MSQPTRFENVPRTLDHRDNNWPPHSLHPWEGRVGYDIGRPLRRHARALTPKNASPPRFCPFWVHHPGRPSKSPEGQFGRHTQARPAIIGSIGGLTIFQGQQYSSCSKASGWRAAQLLGVFRKNLLIVIWATPTPGCAANFLRN